MKIDLTEEKKQRLRERHRSSHDSRTCDRIRCVLLSADGWSSKKIADSQLINETTVLRHIKDYLDKDKLSPENGGSAGYLSVEQVEKVIKYLSDNIMRQTASVRAYIREQWGVEFSLPGMTKWLHRYGFSYKRPSGIPHKFDRAKQEEFVRAYGELKERVGGQEPILFIDGVHPTQSTKLSYGWIPKGQRKTVNTTGSRTRLNIMGALNLQNIAGTITSEYERITGEQISDFLHKIRAHYPSEQSLHIILDGAGYHSAKQVKETAKLLHIELHYLPPYSPNLNPIERLWKVMNELVRNNRYFASAKEFRESIRHFFKETLPTIAGALAPRLNDNFQMLDPAS